MDQTSYNNKLKHISQATKEILYYIDKKRKGLIKPLKTRWSKLNKVMPIEWHNLILLAGISGSGKSSIANELETSLFDYNTEEKFAVLSFNYEMMSARQVGRKLSFKTNKTVSEIYSNEKNLNDEDYNKIKGHAAKIANYKIYYSDIPSSVEEIKKIILNLYELIKVPMVIFLDHSRLVKAVTGKSEFETLNDLATMCIEMKKRLPCTIILLCQLNRDIEKTERVQNPLGHYPQRSDIFGADSLYQGADYVAIVHRPELLNLPIYGPDKMVVQDMIYMHILKNRDGGVGIIKFFNNLQFNRVDEV